jgi:hypothetical protein
MPCDSIQLNQVEIGKLNRPLLLAALKSLGAHSVREQGAALSFYLGGERCTINEGRLTVRAGSESLADRIKVGYSRQAVALAARRSGWQVKEVRANVFQVIK